MNKPSLDSLLKGWAERTQPDVQSLRRLEGWILNSLPGGRLSTFSPVETDAVFHPWRNRLAAAATLVLLLGTGWLLLGPSDNSPLPQAAKNGAAELARYSAGQVAALQVLLDEMETLFAGQIRWVNLEADGMHLGMAEFADPRSVSQPRLAVRTVIVAREGSHSDWETVWSADVLTRAEEYVAMAPTEEEIRGVELWVHRLPDGRFMVDSEIAWPDTVLVRTSESRIYSAGRPEHILTQTIADREYRIYQTIEPLTNGTG